MIILLSSARWKITKKNQCALFFITRIILKRRFRRTHGTTASHGGLRRAPEPSYWFDSMCLPGGSPGDHRATRATHPARDELRRWTVRATAWHRWIAWIVG